MIPRSLGLSYRVEPRSVVAGMLGVLVMMAVSVYLMPLFTLLGNAPLWRVANAAGIAFTWAAVGAILGSLPAWLSRPAIISICTLYGVLYLVLLPFHEVDKYVSTIQLLLMVPPLLLGARLVSRFRGTKAA